jgi:hypothetical protein
MFITFEPHSTLVHSLYDQVQRSPLGVLSFYPFLRTLVTLKDFSSITPVLNSLSQRFEIFNLLDDLKIKTLYFCYGNVEDFQDFMEIAEHLAAFQSQEGTDTNQRMAGWCMEYCRLTGAPSYGSSLYIASALLCGNIEVAALMLREVKVSHRNKSPELISRELHRISSEVAIEMNRFAEKGLIDSLTMALEPFESGGCGVNNFDINAGLWYACTRGQVETAAWINDHFIVGTSQGVEDSLLEDVNMIFSTTFPDTVLYGRLSEILTWISTDANEGGLGYNREN